ncbi:Quinate/shikimate 5-dehydrogenase/glutamyl-tRNA reductase [Penicillium expansum]|nr:Quinate/shikimate 5-dehydrogenase/glutamyl-tRNA reductase [Penicillium expansum]
MSVTVPYKLQVHKFCDEQIKTAQLIGAVNTLTVKGSDSEQKIIYDNTYWSGLYSIKFKDDFKSAFEIKVVSGLQDLPEKPEVVIDTVPAETTTEDQFSSLFSDRGLCVNVSYKPRQTPLLTEAQQNQGWDTITGVEVLLAQAFDQFLL